MSQLSRQDVGASTSHNPVGLHGLLTGTALPFLVLHKYVEAKIFVSVEGKPMCAYGLTGDFERSIVV
jgi:hypothetical protein